MSCGSLGSGQRGYGKRSCSRLPLLLPLLAALSHMLTGTPVQNSCMLHDASVFSAVSSEP